jgi:hypothetical protein
MEHFAGTEARKIFVGIIFFRNLDGESMRINVMVKSAPKMP